MWTVLVLICFISSFDIGATKDQLHPQSYIEHPDSTETRLRKLEDPSIRFPRRFRENSRTRRLHIENQTGFDGKVEKIHINSEEDLPGIRAYGLQKKNLMNNGYIERKIEKEIKEDLNDASRVTRSVEAYGKSKDHLETNGKIERIQSPISPRATSESGNRVSRSIATGSKGEPDDLEAQDAKIFRPLFVYRQQQAKKQHRAKNRFLQMNQNSFYNRRPFF
ncbi:uncharacterized protein LOC114882489 [Osmia bicornis bicornis]|uniref:uncharacterized protein LOC114882489 n=1 Tax=Osmia bicornis bicornis TaxID=1437191 RepID=UPI0010F7510C|nr:uncharacterized protein LOC114882489 [Osmia bicornis bicornis]